MLNGLSSNNFSYDLSLVCPNAIELININKYNYLFHFFFFFFQRNIINLNFNNYILKLYKNQKKNLVSIS